MSLNKCPICHEYIWAIAGHKCKPAYYVFRDDSDLYDAINQEQRLKIWFASDEEAAAIRYCEYDYENPSELDVLVVDRKSYEEAVENFDGDNADVIVEEIHPKCISFSMESELVRNYCATRNS